jgi:hypothetical protein
VILAIQIAHNTRRVTCAVSRFLPLMEPVLRNSGWADDERTTVGALLSACARSPNLASWLRRRNFGPRPNGVSSRSCCASQALVGSRVVTARRTLRNSRCMTTKTKWQRNHRSRTSKRSQHQIPAAWLRRNVDLRCPVGLERKRLR